MTVASVQLILLLLVVAVFQSSYCEDDKPLCDPDSHPELCPPWFQCERLQNGTVDCNCGKDAGEVVQCDPQSHQTYLLVGYCMTYDNISKNTCVGECPYNMYKNVSRHLYVLLPPHASQLDSLTCAPLNREGLLCGKCKNGHGPAVFSGNLHCYNCSGHYQGWGLYLFFELFFATVFFISIVCSHISVTSASMNAFILISQCIVGILATEPASSEYSLGEVSKVLVKLLQICYGFWNLDFFRQAIPPFCVSDKIDNVHFFALQYISAFYPLGLIAIAYVFIALHDRNFRPIVCLWRPIHKWFARFRRTCNPRASIIDVFATFLLLSYSKLAFVSATLMYYIPVYNINGSTMRVLLYQPAVRSFGNPFSILAVVIFLTFIALPPILLLLYPTKVFQKHLSFCTRRMHALHAFADVFQGCYKNGTRGTRDFRYFAGLYFILRILLFLTHTLIPNYILSWIIPGVLFTIASLCFAVLRPYKENFFNNVDSIFLAVFATITFLVPYTVHANDSTLSQAISATIFVLLFCPLLYLIMYVAYIVNKRYCKRISLNAEGVSRSNSLPDRILNPGNYLSLDTGNSAQSHGDCNYVELENSGINANDTESYG